MTTSTNDTNNQPLTAAETGGAFADVLTLIRILLTPLIVFLVVKFWPDTQMAALASFLFVIAALSDIFDDYLGGGSRSANRRFGYLDDIADTVLIVGTLGAMTFVIHRAGLLAWPFAIPVAIIIAREVLVGLFKGFELSKHGWADNALSNAKGGFIMLGTCLLLASPWLTQWVDMTRANEANVMEIFDNASPMVWILGQIALWIGAFFSLLSGIKIFRTNFDEMDDL